MPSDSDDGLDSGLRALNHLTRGLQSKLLFRAVQAGDGTTDQVLYEPRAYNRLKGFRPLRMFEATILTNHLSTPGLLVIHILHLKNDIAIFVTGMSPT